MFLDIPLKQKDTYNIENVKSLTLSYKDIFFSNGKGFDFDTANLTAYAEMAERIISKNFFEDYYLDNIYPDKKIIKFLNKNLNKLYNIDELLKEDLIDFNSKKDEIYSIPFIEKNTQNIIYFPINIIQNLYASNGIAFHTNKQEAYQNALKEIIERYVKIKIIKNNISLPKIPKEFIPNNILNSKYNLEFFDASLNGKYPTTAISIKINNKVMLSFGVGKNIQEALNNAYLELFQGREDFDDLYPLTDDISLVQDAFNIESLFTNNIGYIHKNFFSKSKYKFTNFNFNTFEIFDNIFYRYTKYKTFHTYQIIIPSISEIYPIDDLIYNNKNRYRFYRKYILDYKKHHKKEIINNLEELNPSLTINTLTGILFEQDLTIEEFLKFKFKNLKISKKYKEIKQLLNRINKGLYTL